MEGKWFWSYSNATVLGEKYQDLFLNEYTDYTSLGFSIDATTPETYTKVRRLDYFKTIQRNLEMYFNKASIVKKEKDNSFISNNINMLNLHEVEDMVRFAKNIGAHKLQLSLTYFSDAGMALKGDMLCNENNWELFWEKQQRAEQLAKELALKVEFYYPFHNGYLK
jgi:molybdenum cofactor biosynthesis enzyme MoaA